MLMRKQHPFLYSLLRESIRYVKESTFGPGVTGFDLLPMDVEDPDPWQKQVLAAVWPLTTVVCSSRSKQHFVSHTKGGEEPLLLTRGTEPVPLARLARLVFCAMLCFGSVYPGRPRCALPSPLWRVSGHSVKLFC